MREDNLPRSWSTANLLILVAVAAQAARIFSTSSDSGVTPFHSANDRSRWCTVAALVEDGTYEIDRLIEIRDRSGNRPWNTIDLVQHQGSDGRQHFYSSKPPLLATIYAGFYAPLYFLTGIRLSQHPFYMGRVLLVIINLLPLIYYWRWWTRQIHKEELDDWTQGIAMVFLLWGTFLSTFAVTMNNHLPAAMAVTVSLAAWIQIARNESVRLKWFAVAGCSAAFAATCDLPALSWFGMLALLLLLIDWRRTLIGYTAGAIPVGVAFALTTYIAHQDLRPPYDHRGLGKPILSLPKSDYALQSPDLGELIVALRGMQIAVSPQAIFRPARREKTVELWDEVLQRKYAIVDQGSSWQVCQWDDWYDYPDSYWRPENKRGVDRGEPSKSVYLFQMLVGHHGVFSLTPIWILALIGGVITLRHANRRQVQLAVSILIVSLVCIAYYSMRPLMDRNYGGVASGFRWLFWLTPLWMLLTIPGIHWAHRNRFGRIAVQAALAISVFSAMYGWSNPWVHPWLYSLASYFGWIEIS